MSITPYTNQRYQIGDGSSIYNLKQNLNRFLEDLAKVNFNNILSNCYFRYADQSDIPLSWITSGSSNLLYDEVNEYFSLTLDLNGYIKQNINTKLKANTEYTVIVYCKTFLDNPIKVSINASVSSQIFNLNNTLENNSASVETSSTDMSKYVLQFKTNATAIDGDIFLEFKNELISNNVYIKYAVVYEGLIELNGLPEDEGNTTFLDNVRFDYDINRWVLNYDGVNESLILTSAEVSATLGSVTLEELSYLQGVTSNIQDQLDEKVDTSLLGVANGIATLDNEGKVTADQLPSYIDAVLEYADLASFPVSGDEGKIYVALDTNKTYRWSGSTYVEITSGAVDSVNGKTGVVTLTKSDIGLTNVDDTSDDTKNVLSATKLTTARTINVSGIAAGTATSFNGTANISIPLTSIAASGITGTLAVAKGGTGVTTSTGTGSVVLSVSPTFTGTPLSTTPASGDNSTKIATTAFVQTIFNSIGSSTEYVFPKCQPTLTLDFTKSGMVDPRLICSRASSATALGKFGSLETFLSNQPRLDYDQTTGLCKGLLVESASTNLLLNTTGNLSNQSVSTLTQPYTISFWGTGQIDLSGTYTGTVVGISDTTRTVLQFAPGAGTLIVSVSGNCTRAQLEVGGLTSYIPTYGTTNTRASELIMMKDITDWFNPSQGTMLVEWEWQALETLTATYRTAASIAQAAITSYELTVFGKRNTSGTTGGQPIGSILNSSTQATVAVTGTPAINVNYKAALAYKTNDSTFAWNGQVGTADTICSIPTGLNTLYVGSSDSGLQLNNTIKRLVYYPYRLTDSELIGLTIA